MRFNYLIMGQLGNKKTQKIILVIKKKYPPFETSWWNVTRYKIRQKIHGTCCNVTFH